MSTCHFCGQEFSNSQAVRAHLKACAAYRARPHKPEAVPPSRQGSLGGASLETPDALDAPSGSFDPVRQLSQRIAAEKLRLELRELEQAHRELDQRIQARDQVQQRMQAECEAQRQRDDQHEHGDRRQLAQIQQHEARHARLERRHARRRALIQQVKDEVLDSWPEGVCLTTSLRAQLLQAIEQTLAAVPVLDLPYPELVQIAVGIRDEHYQREQAQAHEREQRHQRRAQLIADGRVLTQLELQALRDLHVFDRWRIEARIANQLERLCGDETAADVEALVERLLEDEGVGDDVDA